MSDFQYGQWFLYKDQRPPDLYYDIDLDPGSTVYRTYDLITIKIPSYPKLDGFILELPKTKAITYSFKDSMN